MAFQAEQASSPANVHLLNDKMSGLNGAIVLHSTVLGPAAGGCRLWTYSDRQAMLTDACRLAEGMSYKNAMAGLPLGGGKAVICLPEGEFDRKALFRAFGRAVQALRGRYVTAEDVGTTVEDMTVVRDETRHVAGLHPKSEGPGGDPSPWTARGTFLSMQVAVERRLQKPLSECTVAVQGVGNVGAALARMLHEAGAKLIISDVNAVAVARVAIETQATVASTSGILSASADVFAPCALGAVINDKMLGKLKAKVVCGAANNQLATPEDGRRLADRDILYAPDYVVNAGGIINVAAEYLDWSSKDAAEKVEAIGARLGRVFDHAAENGFAPHEAADRIARKIIASAGTARCVAA